MNERNEEKLPVWFLALIILIWAPLVGIMLAVNTGANLVRGKRNSPAYS